MIVVVNHERANIFSLCNALAQIGAEFKIATAANDVLTAKRILLPGVGAFADVMNAISANGFVEPICEAARRGTPLLGICVGMQVLTKRSEEFGEWTGLGLLSGNVRRLPCGAPGSDCMRVPNVGWRPVKFASGDGLFGSLEPNAMFYFVHSYAVEAGDPSDVIATATFNRGPIVAAVRKKNVVGVQFHPEKSGAVGLALLRNFVTREI